MVAFHTPACHNIATFGDQHFSSTSLHVPCAWRSLFYCFRDIHADARFFLTRTCPFPIPLTIQRKVGRIQVRMEQKLKHVAGTTAAAADLAADADEGSSFKQQSVLTNKSLSQEVVEAEERLLVRTYGRSPVVFVKGEGCKLFDAEGREYLDLAAGIAVNALGYGDPTWLKAVTDQAATLAHVSNLYYSVPQEAAEELSPRLDLILQHLMFAFGRYQRRNLRILYDAIGTLADAVGAELNEPRYLEILMPPLIAKWQQLSDSDKDLFPLLECFTSIAQALGPGFAQYAEPVFARCIILIRTQVIAKVNHGRAGVAYDKEFIVCSLDLLSGLAEGLGSSIESLVGRSDLRDLLLQCCNDVSSDVRQSAFALLGDLAKACAVHLQPCLGEFLNLAAKQLGPDVKENVSVANNACWAIGEVVVKMRQEISPIVLNVIASLVPILSNGEGLNKSLLENSAITLGRLGWVCPDLVAPHMEHFLQPWCLALRQIRDDVEKEDAFRGLSAMVRINPAGAVSSFVPMCDAIGSWHEIRSGGLQNELCQVLHGFKQILAGGVWEQCMSALDPALREKLVKAYGI